MTFKVDKSGTTVGRLKIYRIVHDSKGKLRYQCSCSCGVTCYPNKGDVDFGKTNSCGCGIRAATRQRNYSHRMTGTKIHGVWTTMLNRCRNPKMLKYRDYGARGIKVCERWKKFENFYEDMGQCPADGMSIDRIDTNGDYCKENCRWATAEEQALNTRRNRLVTFNGKTLPMSIWCKRFDLIYSTAINRLNKGMPAEQIFAMSVRKNSNIKIEKEKQNEYR
jgi:hypothetical protein